MTPDLTTTTKGPRMEAQDKIETQNETQTEAGTLHQTLVANIRNLLIEGGLAAGQRIPEAELCQRFGVSRTPLREALKVLASEGFIQLRPNRGAILAPLDPDQIAPIFELKGALERLIGLTAAERATEAELSRLSTLHLSLNDTLASGNLATYTQLNYDFHRGLAEATRNAELMQSYDILQQKIWRFRFLVNDSFSRIEESFAEHEQIMIALRARTPLDLAARLEAHNQKTCDAMQRAVAQLDQPG
ncbi:GntR family transcriptional regulator [Maritimibacter alkaliphilus]|uniref:GntR family transcriptional regulator n=1 Tax=Maritimibacter alkaliphilus TaxID=404236 RepID=UPI0021BD62F6|nr:GntR family transcriptional regulator [Maritimibacter alkaliphilus]